MEKYSEISSFGAAESFGEIVLLHTMSEGKYFRVIKARQGTKFIILKTCVVPDSMSEGVLRHEYELTSTLSHPCIIRTIGFEENTPAGPAIIMEYINGRTLDEFIATGPSMKSKASVLSDIMEGLEYLHRRGILHNDLKPANIIVNGKGTAHIIDFGLSESEDSLYVGFTGGTQGYSAPEIVEGKGSSGVASDIYSLGMLTELIFGGRKYRSLVRKSQKIRPSDRPQSVAEFRGMMRRSDRFPYLLLGVILLMALLSFIFVPRIQEDITESEEEEKLENIQNRIKGEMTPDYIQALEIMKEQKYKELALTVFNLYSYKMNHYLDSVMKVHPMTADGKFSQELMIASDCFTQYRYTMDSIVNSLPSMSYLPVEQQESEYAAFAEKYLNEYQH